MKFRILSLSAAITLALASSATLAGDFGHGHKHHKNCHDNRYHGKPAKVVEHHHYYHDRPRHERREDVWARVVDVEPIMARHRRDEPRQECWTESVQVTEYDQPYESYTGTLVGGIIGGAIGNAVGHKKVNKRIGTAVGAVLGASVGRDLSIGQQSRGSQTSYRDEPRCTTRYQVSYDEEIIGYRVFYRYDGEVFETRTDSHPGDRIRVRPG